MVTTLKYLRRTLESYLRTTYQLHFYPKRPRAFLKIMEVVHLIMISYTLYIPLLSQRKTQGVYVLFMSASSLIMSSVLSIGCCVLLSCVYFALTNNFTNNSIHTPRLVLPTVHTHCQPEIIIAIIFIPNATY